MLTLRANYVGAIKKGLRRLKKNHPIIDKPFTYELISIYWHLNQEDFSSTYIDLHLKKGAKIIKLRFYQPVQVKIGDGFDGNICGMLINDISSQQLDRLKVEVVNFEQDPGITFKANTVEEID